MSIFLSKDQVENIWKIRCKAIQQFRNVETLSQGYKLTLTISVVLAFFLGFEVTFIITNIFLFMSKLVILFYLRQKIVASNKKYLLIMMYDLLAFAWMSFISINVGVYMASNQLDSDGLASYLKINIFLAIATGVLTSFFSKIILNKKIEIQAVEKKDRKFSFKSLRYLSLLIGCASGISLLLSNLNIYSDGIEASGVFLLSAVFICVFVFFLTLNLVELLYFLYFNKINLP